MLNVNNFIQHLRDFFKEDFMNTFVDNVTKILKEQKITKNKLLSDLNLNRNSFDEQNARGNQRAEYGGHGNHR